MVNTIIIYNIYYYSFFNHFGFMMITSRDLLTSYRVFLCLHYFPWQKNNNLPKRSCLEHLSPQRFRLNATTNFITFWLISFYSHVFHKINEYYNAAKEFANSFGIVFVFIKLAKNLNRYKFYGNWKEYINEIWFVLIMLNYIIIVKFKIWYYILLYHDVL